MFKNKKVRLLSIFMGLVSCPVVLGATSCSSSSSIDEKYRININIDGKLVNELTYKDAIKAALSNPTSYQDFKSALADEIVLKWFMHKMADSSGQHGNAEFRDQYDEMIAIINRDYDKIVQECRDKYGTNYHFYLQNEYLTPNGGTEESYKHNQLLTKVKELFQKQVFAKSYFGFRKNQQTDSLPIIRSDVDSVTEAAIDNPANWDRIGFFAKIDDNFKLPENQSEYLEYIKKSTAADYATLQNYIFDRWFATEQPFFTAASLFKYSNPKDLGKNNVDDIYNVSKSKMDSVPQSPTEAFPFFGPIDISKERNKGTSGFYQWYQKLLETGFLTKYQDGEQEIESNGTISIETNLSEDSQTLLLCVGSTNFQDMVAPYAIGDGSLYSQMLGYCGNEAVNNQLNQDDLVVPSEENWKSEVQVNNSFILKNFFYTTEEAKQEDGEVKSKLKVRPETIKSYTDLKKLYQDNSQNTTKTHNYDIFKKTKDFTDFYGIEDDQYGARYVTSNFQVDLTKKTDTARELSQPWYFELNNFGIHVQTIDGYAAVKKGTTLEARQHAAKNVLKYRLLQHKNGFKKFIFGPTNVFDSGTRLDVYFKRNYANIILEMALGAWNKTNISDTASNIFCSNFGDLSSSKEEKNYLNELWSENNFHTYESFCDYLNKTINIDWYKKALDHYKEANESIYSSKTEAVATSKHNVNWDTKKYANGVLSPIGFKYSVVENSYDYCDDKIIACTIPYDQNFGNLLAKDGDKYKPQPLLYSDLANKIKDLQNSEFIANVFDVSVNDASHGFSPQTTNAKNAGSNSFWYTSPLVTKFMQSEKVSSYILNKIYNDTFNGYFANINFDVNDNVWKELTGDVLTSKYLASKVLTKENNYSCLVKSKNERENYIDNINDAWKTKQDMQIIDNYTLDNDDIVALNKIKATLAWLMSTSDAISKDYFKNFYNILSNKITTNKKAYIGYLARVHDLYFDNVDKEEKYSTRDQSKKIIYDWQSEVNNIYDQHNYHGIGYHEQEPINEQRDVDDEYWTSIISKNVEQKIKQWTGFSGLLTETDPGIINGNSDLKKALFEELAKHTCSSSLSLFDNSDKKVSNNQGIWFAYSSEIDENGNPITFKITSSSGETIDQTKFVKTKKVLGLAKAIVDKNSKESLRSFINDLIKCYYYAECPFKPILDKAAVGSESLDDLKFALLKVLPTDPNSTSNDQVIDYNCFKRLTNIQLHSNEGSNNLNYSFINNENGDGYKMIITQINHEDVIGKTLHPRTNGENAIDPNEFYSLVISLAMDESIQKIALNEMIKVCYHGEKLQVYDAIIYNLLNGTWVKDWNRKTYDK